MFNLKTLLWNPIFLPLMIKPSLLEQTDPEQTKLNNIFVSLIIYPENQTTYWKRQILNKLNQIIFLPLIIYHENQMLQHKSKIWIIFTTVGLILHKTLAWNFGALNFLPNVIRIMFHYQTITWWANDSYSSKSSNCLSTRSVSTYLAKSAYEFNDTLSSEEYVTDSTGSKFVKSGGWSNDVFSSTIFSSKFLWVSKPCCCWHVSSMRLELRKKLFSFWILCQLAETNILDSYDSGRRNCHKINSYHQTFFQAFFYNH